MPIPLNNLYEENDMVKKLGAKWSKDKKCWYVPDGVDFRPFKKWISAETLRKLTSTQQKPQAVRVAFSELFSDISSTIHLPKKYYSTEADVHDCYNVKDIYYLYTLMSQHNLRQTIKIKITKEVFQHYFPDQSPEYLVDKHISIVGSPYIYSKSLDMQLKINNIRVDGPCSRLKKEAQWEQEYSYLFRTDLENKKYPVIPFEKVGLITSLSSKAHSDFMDKIYERRIPKENIIEKDVKVTEKSDIINAIRELNAENDCQLICIIRGGGDPEELFLFSHPDILLAIHNSAIPIIVGIGHKDDMPLCNYVATYDARTPSGTADCLNYIVGKLHKDEAVRQAYHARSKNEYDRIDWQARCLEAEDEVEDLKAQITLLQNQLADVTEKLDKKSNRGLFGRIFNW